MERRQGGRKGEREGGNDRSKELANEGGGGGRRDNKEGGREKEGEFKSRECGEEEG